jgi:signal transduction histidine kinase
MWRIAGFMAGAFLFVGVIITIGVVLVGIAVGLIPAPAVVRVLAIAALALFLLVIFRAARRFQRAALNAGELVDAAGRIETGDYGVQVAERGPRELRTLARAFNAMSARLAATERDRRAFVADLTHEFRTPLAIIRGQAEGIGDGVYPGDHAHLAPILDATASLETLVEALGTMTLADVGSLRLNREAVEVGVLVNSSLAAFQSMADAAGVRLVAEVAVDTPPIDADPARIRGVLANLLSNAIRHTPSGGLVSVSARRSGDMVTIAVRDTGHGIPEEMRPRVFERFVKEPGSPGAGLGLAIAKDIVLAHGGAIDLTSEVGKGTEVRVTLPIAR